MGIICAVIFGYWMCWSHLPVGVGYVLVLVGAVLGIRLLTRGIVD